MYELLLLLWSIVDPELRGESGKGTPSMRSPSERRLDLRGTFGGVTGGEAGSDVIRKDGGNTDWSEVDMAMALSKARLQSSRSLSAEGRASATSSICSMSRTRSLMI
jgi:hypothetical protein